MENLSGIDAATAANLTKQINDMIDKNKFENIELEMITINVTAGTTMYNNSHTTSLRHKRIVGVALNITDEAVLEGATMSLSIDSKEIFPSGCEAKLLFANTAVAPNSKFYTYVDLPINQTKVDVTFTSKGYSAPYKAIFYLMCQTKS